MTKRPMGEKDVEIIKITLSEDDEALDQKGSRRTAYMSSSIVLRSCSTSHTANVTNFTIHVICQPPY